jgi:pimeloyl-ACP methyl ester carboxylesterase
MIVGQNPVYAEPDAARPIAVSQNQQPQPAMASMNTQSRSAWRKWLKRIGLVLMSVLVITITAGALYERSARQRIAKELPPPGKMINVGAGRRIHLDCRGSGTPIVVLETIAAPMGGASWFAVHDAVAKTTRTCAYDRAGLGWSDPASGPRTGVAIVNDLHNALQAAHEPAPYVMVGASLGGPLIMTYTKYFGEEVAGLVFVDASHPDQDKKIEEVTGKRLDYAPGAQKVLAALAWTGLPRLLLPPTQSPEIPPQVARAIDAHMPTSLGPSLAEIAQLHETWREAGTLRTLGDRPVAVLTAARPYSAAELATFQLTEEQGKRMQEAWFALQREEASWSSRSTHKFLSDSSHGVQFERPDAIIAAIGEVLEQIRAGQQRPAAE